ncbi:M66 family metalloprotease [Marinobacter sp. 1Y8]
MSKKILGCTLAGLFLSGCGGGGDSDTPSSAALAEISENQTPAVAQLPYHHQPKVRANTAPIQFTADGLPAWASLDARTGAISGTPGPDDVTAYAPYTLTVTTDAGKSSQNQVLRVLATEAYLAGEPALAFDATDYDGNKRTIRNDLSGGPLKGQVTFGQSHTVKPNSNFVRDEGDETRSVYKPKPVALRDALLLFTPDTANTPITVDVMAFLNGEPAGRFAMSHPNALPRSDHSGQRRVEYSTRAWSVRLPWELMRNGLSLKFIVNGDAPDALTGQLIASDIDIGEASQIVFQSIRLGMLTPVERNANHFTLNDPVLAATDYFQTLPVSKLVMGSYADMELDRVIIGSGKIYTDASDDEGGIYSGDMRGDVAKSQVSVGINEANYGVTSNSMRQSYPHIFKQITNHHAWGNYQNGRQGHGLSGGNGIGTLSSSSGNEASHEWGHAYGLGHYPGSTLTEDGRWQRHHADSGWGYIAYRNRMRDNIHNDSWTDEAKPFGSHFMGHIEYRKDAMSGGWGHSPFSSYTFYTSFSARLIQQDLARYPIPDETYETGYKKWDTETGQYKAHRFQASQDVLAPVKTGVPVATILGGYDPDGTNAVIYPVFHGNYGNVFELPEPEMSSTTGICWVNVRNASGAQKRIEVAAQRHNGGSINQLHFNLEATFRPTEATLTCRRNGSDIELTRTTFDGQIPELPPAAIVGQEHGYKQLRDREIAQLNAALETIAADHVPVLPNEARLWLSSYSDADVSEGLSTAAKAVLARIQKTDDSIMRAQALVSQQGSEGTSASETQDLLTELLIDRGMIAGPADVDLKGDVIKNGNNRLSTTLNDKGHITVVTGAAGQPEAAQWLMTARGSLHPIDQPWNCLIPSGGHLGLAICDPHNSAQSWIHDDSDRLRNVGNGQCVDYDYSQNRALMYGCHGGGNQRWLGVLRTNSVLLATLPGSVLQTLYGR